jgi:hypothetical protein
MLQRVSMVTHGQLWWGGGLVEAITALQREGRRAPQLKIANVQQYWGPTPSHTGRLTVSRNLTSTSAVSKGLECLHRGWANLFPGNINRGTWPSRLGESHEREYGHQFCRTWTWKCLLWQGPEVTVKLQTHLLIREGALHQDTRSRQTENKNLAMGFRWEPDTKTDWLTDCRS